MNTQPCSLNISNRIPALLCSGLLCAAVLAGAARAQSADTETPPSDEESARLRTSIELLRSDVRAEKAQIIAANITFTAEEAAAFWPLHTEYNAALNRLLDERLYLINEYLGLYERMTDKEATALATKVFDWEARSTKLKRTWFKKFSKAVSAKKAAQFFQLEGQLNAAIALQISANLPLIR
jgi:hypothetical protein